MEKDFLNTEANVVKVLENKYNIGQIKEVKKLVGGGSSECYKILTDDSMYIFKDIKTNFMNHPHQEPLIHKILIESGIPVSKFYPTKDGEYVWESKGRFFHLQSFIDGNILGVNAASEWFMVESAHMLGKIHSALEAIPLMNEGIGEKFFNFLNPERVRGHYLDSIEVAKKANDHRSVNDIEYRIRLLDVIKDIELDINQFTRKNTHGDYFISQIICGDNCINGVIDFTAACVHPVCWEVIRSYSFADPECINGSINTENLKRYIENYLKYYKLNSYDIKMMPYLYFYQLVVSNYFQQYYESKNSNKEVLLEYAHWSTLVCRWFEQNVANLSDELLQGF